MLDQHYHTVSPILNSQNDGIEDGVNRMKVRRPSTGKSNTEINLMTYNYIKILVHIEQNLGNYKSHKQVKIRMALSNQSNQVKISRQQESLPSWKRCKMRDRKYRINIIPAHIIVFLLKYFRLDYSLFQVSIQSIFIL